MKKTMLAAIAVLLIIIQTLTFPVKVQVTASAATNTAMVISDDALLYSDASGRLPRFYVDKSYFVVVESIVGDFARVVYMDGFDDSPAIEGYVKVIDLSFFDKQIEAPFPDVMLTATADVVMFSDAETTRPHTVVPVNGKVRYYGRFSLGGNDMYYIYYKGNVGYVPASSFAAPEIKPHKEYLDLISAASSQSTQTASEQTQSQSQTGKTDDSALNPTQIIIVVLLIVAGLAIIYFIVRPDKLGGKHSVYSGDE